MLQGWFINIKGRKTPIVGLVTAIVLFIAIFIINLSSYYQTRLQARQAIGKNLLSIARATAILIDGDRFAALFAPPPELKEKFNSNRYKSFLQNRHSKPEFRSIQKKLKMMIRAQQNLGFSEENIYTFFIDRSVPNENQNVVRWGVMAHKKTFVGKPYLIPPAMDSVVRGKKSGSFTDIYLSTDSGALWMSGFAPILNGKGQVVGIVDVSWEVEQVISEVTADQRIFFWLSLATVVLGFLAALILIGITRHLGYTIQSKKHEEIRRKQAQTERLHAAYYDELTGLPNRELLQIILQNSRYRYADGIWAPVAVCTLNIDRFKHVNDTLGHDVGDHLLEESARRIRKFQGSHDELARVGGNEFVLLMEEQESQTNTRRRIEAIQSALTAPFMIDGHEIYITATAGVYFMEGPGEPPEILLRNSETALYRARNQGRGGLEFFTGEMQRKTVSLLIREHELRKANLADEFLAYFQPILSLKTGRISGFEALARWNKPDQGIVGPGEFIMEAEDTGLIDPIGETILRKACATLVDWENKGFRNIWVAVNFSAHQFRDPTLPGKIATILRETGLAPKCLKAEITESVAMSDLDLTVNILTRISQSGIGVSIDDFGVGYSSLAYLSRFPINTLKIDKSFLDQYRQDPEKGALIKAIIAIAHSLDLGVVAEGIETPEQARFLYDNGCDNIQGFLLGKPMPAADALEFLQQDVPDLLGA